MKTLSFIVSVLAFFSFNISALQLPASFARLGGGQEGQSSFLGVADVCVAPDKTIYVLDSANGNIHKFSSGGKHIITLARLGQNKGELFKPQSLIFVGGELWVADTWNERISVFSGDKFKRSFRVANIAMPAYIVPLGENVLVSGDNLMGKTGKAMALISRENKFIKLIEAAINVETTVDKLWNFVAVDAAGVDKAMIGFKFHNTVKLVDQNGAVVSDRNMTPFYAFYGETKDKLQVPSGFAAYSFSPGPENSLLILTCDQEKRRCNRIMRFNSDLTKYLDDVAGGDYEGMIRRIRYFPQHNILSLITASNIVYCYHIPAAAPRTKKK